MQPPIQQIIRLPQEGALSNTDLEGVIAAYLNPKRDMSKPAPKVIEESDIPRLIFSAIETARARAISRISSILTSVGAGSDYIIASSTKHIEADVQAQLRPDAFAELCERFLQVLETRNGVVAKEEFIRKFLMATTTAPRRNEPSLCLFE